MSRLILVCLLAGLFGPFVSAGESDPVVRGALGRRLDGALQRATGGGFWGAVLVARKGQPILAKGYGFADYGQRANTPATLFEIASVSKQFTAAAVMVLVQRGKLKLTDTLGRHFPGVPADKQAMTVHQLLAHTSGLDPGVGLPYATRKTRAQLEAHVLASKLAAPPGRKFAYSNAGYALLAALVERVSGKSFEAFSREALFGPAGLVDTGFVGDRELGAGRVSARLSPYRTDATATDWFWSWGYRGMGGVVSTVHDLARWDRALRGDRLLDAAHRKLLYTPLRNGYACGWQVSTTPRGTTLVSHSGGVRGYRANLLRFLDEDALVVVLSNDRCQLHQVTQALTAALFPPPRLRLAVDVAGYALGKYQNVTIEGLTWRVSDGPGLRMDLYDPKRKRVLAVVEGTAGMRKKLKVDLARALAAQPGGGPQGTEGGVYLSTYELDARRKLTMDEGLALQVYSRYVGVGEGGKRVVDQRVLLIVVDSRRGRWPVMSKLDAPAARRLLVALGQ